MDNTVLAPRYLAEFSCLGSACPENCCTGWTVQIDKPAYQRYRAVREQPLAGLFERHLQRKPTGGARGHAVILLREDKSCPLLDEQALCRIHAQLGEAALSDTCRDYPRQLGLDGALPRLHATLSCPEAARLALADAAALDPVELPRPRVAEHRRRPAPAADESDPVRKHAVLLGEAVEGLIRLPGTSAAQSLVLVGMLLRRIAAIRARGQAGEIELAEALEHDLAPERLAEAPAQLAALAVPRAVQLDLLLGSTLRFVERHGGRPPFRALMGEVQLGLGLAEGNAVALARIEAALRDGLAPLEAAQPHLLKNYLLNDLGKSLFPRGGVEGLEREFMGLALRFALIRLYALGLAARRGADFGAPDVVRVVQQVARNIEHQPRFLPELLDTLTARGALRLEFLATLVL